MCACTRTRTFADMCAVLRLDKQHMHAHTHPNMLAVARTCSALKHWRSLPAMAMQWGMASGDTKSAATFRQDLRLRTCTHTAVHTHCTVKTNSRQDFKLRTCTCTCTYTYTHRSSGAYKHASGHKRQAGLQVVHLHPHASMQTELHT